MKHFLWLLLLVFMLQSARAEEDEGDDDANNDDKPENKTVNVKNLVVLIDGFRWDYAERLDPEEIPNFWRFMSQGARAEYTQPIFPAISYPSWTSIMTGKRFKMGFFI